jgi:chromosome segregation protein
MSRFLNKIELIGFKSFAGKVTLELPAGITAIVGPNGSGKSNVVDAIRWLLGERDAKNLRGGKSEDLIFAGTPQRARVGQAQASLYFENHNGFFPIDAPEAVVTRQVGRDGTSKYFINRSEVLLRDLIDFLAKARLGARGLIVVTQGNSDLFIQASPRGRREMIEEILGLREYQLKRRDAERRLEQSGINLEKVRALIEELAPHLRSLKRQTGRWEKRDALAQELRTLEDRFFGSQLHALIGQLDRIAAEQAEHAKALPALESEKEKALAKQQAIEDRSPEERRELSGIKESLYTVLNEQSVLQKEIGRLEAQLETQGGGDHKAKLPPATTLHTALTELHSAIEDALKLEGDALRNALQKMRDRVRAALHAGEERAATTGDAKLQQQLAEKQKALTALADRIEALNAQAANLEKSQASFYDDFKAAVAEMDAATRRIEAWHDAMRRMEGEKERYTVRHEEVVRQIEQAGRRAEDFARGVAEGAAEELGESDLGALEKHMLRLRGELASIGDVDEALIKEAQDMETRHAFLTQEAKDLEKAQDDLRSLIDELQERIRKEFASSLVRINKEFNKFFGLMFGGGEARLRPVALRTRTVSATDPEDEEGASENSATQSDEEQAPEEGVDVEVKLPKKRLGSLDVLSGGERSLVGIAALFALISVSPPPFLVLDEIDAPLDERNARRFSEMLKEFSKHTQFILVTHNRVTMEAADVLYGVTLDTDGTSKVVSLKITNEYAAPAAAEA